MAVGVLAATLANPALADAPQHEITAGALRDWPPHYQLDEDGDPIGFAIDILQAVARRADLRVRYRIFDSFPEMQDALLRGEIDVIPNFGLTAAREEFADFTPPVETFAIQLFIRSDMPGINGLGDLRGRRIAAVRSNAAIQLLRDAGFEPTIYADVPDALFDLLSGRIDALAYPASVLRARAREAGVGDNIRAVGAPLTEIKRAIAVRHGDTALLNRLSAGVEELLRSDEYRRIYTRWHGSDPPFWDVRRVVWAAGILLATLVIGVGVWRLRVLAAHNRELRAHVEERDAAQDALSESEAKYRQIVETSAEGVWLIDQRQETIFVNQRMAEMLGLRPDQMLGRPLSDFFDADLNGQADRNMDRRRQGIAELHEFPLRHADGHDIHTLMATSPIIEDGKFLGALAMVTDVTDHRRLQEQLYQSQKLEALGRLAGGVAHDFNNLLLVINAAIMLAGNALPEGNPAANDLADIADASERARALTAQLLAFSRKQASAPERLRPAARIANSGALVRRLLGEDVELSLPSPDDGAAVVIDPGQLDQVVFNMAVNARDAMAAGGKFSIRVQELPGGSGDAEVLLTFEDEGPGMPPEVRARIFEPFFTTKPEGEGTGLGLATCYGIVTGAGGRIEVVTQPGAGTRFLVYLPRAEDAVAEADTTADDEAAPRALTVLLVEDEEIVRRLVARLLEEQGHTVMQADDPAHALELCTTHAGDLDLLVTDIIMPGMNGRDLGRHARQLIPGLAILYMSGHTDLALRSIDELDERETFLPKPFTPDNLLRVMAEIARPAPPA